MGTKAWEKAPSAKSRRNRLGSLKATKKASVMRPAPKARAIRRSRMKPVMRESRVKLLMVASALSRFMQALSGYFRVLCRACREFDFSLIISRFIAFCYPIYPGFPLRKACFQESI